MATNDSRWERQIDQCYYVLPPNTLCHAKNVYCGGSGYWQGHDRNGKGLSGSVDCHTAESALLIMLVILHNCLGVSLIKPISSTAI